MMRQMMWTVPAVLALVCVPGCGSSSGDSGTEVDTTQPAPLTRGSGARGVSPSRGPSADDPNGQDPASPAGASRDGTHRLAADLDDMIQTLETGSGEDFIEAHVDPYTVSQVKQHNTTFPDRESLKKLYEGFEEGVAHDLLLDLRACKSLTPEIHPQEDNWYVAYYDDESLTAEVVLAYDPENRGSWYLIELPLTTPWGTAQSQSNLWREWQEEVAGGPVDRLRVEQLGDFDPHLNPAAVLWGMQRAFAVERGDRHYDLRAYANLLAPQSRRVQAAILMKRILVHDRMGDDMQAMAEVFDRHGIDREGLNTGFRFAPESDVDFYIGFADRIPESAELADVIVDLAELYEQWEGKKYDLHIPSSGANPQPRIDGDVAEFSVRWEGAVVWNPKTMFTRFIEIDGKWYVESYWEANARQ